MKFKSCYLGLFFFSSLTAIGAVDYSHCVEGFKNFGEKSQKDFNKYTCETRDLFLGDQKIPNLLSCQDSQKSVFNQPVKNPNNPKEFIQKIKPSSESKSQNKVSDDRVELVYAPASKSMTFIRYLGSIHKDFLSERVEFDEINDQCVLRRAIAGDPKTAGFKIFFDTKACAAWENFLEKNNLKQCFKELAGTQDIFLDYFGFESILHHSFYPKEYQKVISAISRLDNNCHLATEYGLRKSVDAYKKQMNHPEIMLEPELRTKEVQEQ